MILLDTHALLWWVSDQGKLPPKIKNLIKQESIKSGVLVSSITVWEICLLVQKKKVVLDMDIETWINKVENIPLIKFVPVNNQIACKSVNLPDTFHKDPADRIIIATAREMGAKLVTGDIKIRNYKEVQSIW